MATLLDRPLRRALTIDGEPYVVTLTPDGVRVVRKGHRKGVEVSWRDILSGGVTLDAQLVGSLRGEGTDKTGRHRSPDAAEEKK